MECSEEVDFQEGGVPSRGVTGNLVYVVDAVSRVLSLARFWLYVRNNKRTQLGKSP